MWTVLFLLIYFWYFYFCSLPAAAPTPHTPNPQKPSPYSLQFIKTNNLAFEFQLNAQPVWKHTLSGGEKYLVTGDEKIREIDPCFFHNNRGVKLPATGLPLYLYVKNHPQYKNIISFKEDSEYTAQQGTVFYFVCANKRIESLQMCDSGHVFQNQNCISVSACTGLPNGTLLPVDQDIHKYIECKNGKIFTKNCKGSTFFYHNQCVREADVAHQCRLQGTLPPIALDPMTLFECRDHKPLYTRCPPGTRLFDRLVCEPDDCLHQPDNTLLPLETRTQGIFKFSPGYKVCRGGKVSQTVECSSVWDPQDSSGDDLLFLPRVFDGQQCAVPTFCENVHTDDLDVHVPVHDFTKHLRNWKWSEFLDRSVGTVCLPGGQRKRKLLDPGHVINKQFKVEWACDNLADRLPIYDQPHRYYDCGSDSAHDCPADQFFDGQTCRDMPSQQTFQYRGIPFFNFDSLNAEGWMPPWEYPPPPLPPSVAPCQGPDYEFLRVYNICAHTDCKPYAFLSMIPDLSLFLPQQAKCRYDESDRYLRKEPVTQSYRFWDQAWGPSGGETCTVGQKLKTGHFIWDTTVLATCDLSQPFVFCPSHHTAGRLVLENNVWACEAPPTTLVTHPAGEWKSYAQNEMQRILPPVWDGQPYTVRLTKRDALRDVPQNGLYLPKGNRLTLHSNRDVLLELRYRVTHPPHAVFSYEGGQGLLTGDPMKAFHVRSERFIDTPLGFPQYRPELHVPDFSVPYHP